MICPVCDGESGRGRDVRTCRDCLAESMLKRKRLTLETAQKFCECFRFGHDKEKLEKAQKKRLERVLGVGGYKDEKIS